MLDIQSLLQPITPDAPGGPNLEYSAEYAELERLAQGKPERQVGETIVPAEEPDWGSVVQKSLAILRTSKDLRVAMHLVRGLLKTQAYPGLADGLTLIRGFIDGYWPVLQPRLDEEDNDPTSRVNAMAALTHRDMLHALRAAPLIKSRAIGVITLRDFEAGSTYKTDGSSGSAASVDAAIADMPLPDLTSAAQAVAQCNEAARGIEAAWGAHLEARGPDFSDLRRILAQANQLMAARLQARQPAAEEEGVTPGAASDGAAPAARGAGRGELRSREDVVRALDGICAYYARNEPSSPVPLLLERCKRLATMSFLDIVKDMLPDGLQKLETIAGKPNE
jgi:type VI secretion system protein ImpA